MRLYKQPKATSSQAAKSQRSNFQLYQIPKLEPVLRGDAEGVALDGGPAFAGTADHLDAPGLDGEDLGRDSSLSSGDLSQFQSNTQQSRKALPIND